MTPDKSDSPQTAVWYFVAAMFVFVVPGVLLPDVDPFLRMLIIGAGFVLIILGGMRLNSEMSGGRDRRDAPPDDDHAPG